jgi:hypothetical protein
VSFEASKALPYGQRAVSFTKKAPRNPPRFLARRVSPFPFGLFVRTALLAIVAVGGAAWALHRHYTHELASLMVPRAPKPAPTYDTDAGEIPVPELEPSAPP